MRFVLVNLEEEEEREVSFAEFLSIMKGATITGSEASGGVLEINTSDGVTFRFDIFDSDLYCFMFSDLEPDEFPTIRFQLIAEGETPLASVVEEKIFALRQAYAMEYLLANNVSKDLIDAFKKNPDIDAEATLLPLEDRLYIRSASPGSFWITIGTKSVKAFRVAKGMAAKGIMAIPFEEGRELLIRQIHAQTRIKEIEAEDKQLELDLKRANGFMDIAKKASEIEDPDIRTAFHSKVLPSLLEGGSENRPALPKPDDSSNEK